jgi:5'-3' exonuclease
MSVLVRSARAAARVKQLSHEGVTTGPLLMFAGTMVSHLAAAPWDYVVVAWEGLPDLNWRKKFYPAYKSARPAHADDAPLMSHDEELAREFCEAAGLCQDWAAQFEGDDVIAAWWREFRLVRPDAAITILTSDRDLLQLCDDATVWRAWKNEVMTQGEVYAQYGVQPKRLALLRAIAGDPSDDIPGLKGLGLVKALAIANRPGDPLAVIHSLAAELGIDQLAQLYAWYIITDLQTPVVRPDLGRMERIPRARWKPAEHGRSMRAVLERYGMARMITRLEAGKLPWPGIPE